MGKTAMPADIDDIAARVNAMEDVLLELLDLTASEAPWLRRKIEDRLLRCAVEVEAGARDIEPAELEAVAFRPQTPTAKVIKAIHDQFMSSTST